MKERIRTSVGGPAVCSLLVSLALIAGAGGVRARGYSVEDDILYLDPAEADARLDLYLPTDAGPPLPTVVYIAPQTLPDENVAVAYAAHLTEQGYALAGVTGRPERIGSDSFCALAWLHANADAYGLDPDRFATFGVSGGAMPAAMLGSVGDAEVPFMDGCPNPVPSKPWVAGVVLYEGLVMTPVALVQPFIREGTAQYRGLSRDEVDRLYDLLIATPPAGWLAIDDGNAEHRSMIEDFPPAWIDGNEVPFLLLYGTASDMPYLADDARTFAGYLEAVGVPVEVIQKPGLTHDVSALVGHTEEMDAFLAQVFDARGGTP